MPLQPLKCNSINKMLMCWGCRAIYPCWASRYWRVTLREHYLLQHPPRFPTKNRLSGDSTPPHPGTPHWCNQALHPISRTTTKVSANTYYLRGRRVCEEREVCEERGVGVDKLLRKWRVRRWGFNLLHFSYILPMFHTLLYNILY